MQFYSPDYTQLMEKRIRRILMICSSYDAYILEEDGQIDVQIQKEYSDLNISNPPSFSWVTTSEEAHTLLHNGEDFDLIICMFNIGDMDVFSFARNLREEGSDTPIVLLSNYSREFKNRIEQEDCSAINYIFSWHGNADLILAIVKLLEDTMNAEEDILHSGVQCILLVEDSVRYYSTYLPAIYKLVLKQSAEFLKETLNDQQQKTRKRARPKIFLATNYEDAVAHYEKYKKNLLGVISDVGFILHKNDPSDTEKLDAGIDLCRMIREDDPQMPILLQSSQQSMSKVARELGVGFLMKDSKALLMELSEYIGEEFAFGDFVVRNLVNGEEIARVKNLRELQSLIKQIPDKELLYHTSRNRLSKWLFARGLFNLARPIRDAVPSDFENVTELREFIIALIKEYRFVNGQGVIARFDKDTYSRYITFARIGEGSLGGKARGLAFLNRLLVKYNLSHKYKGIFVTIPQTVVIAADYFDTFMVDNGLRYVVNTEGITDEEILSEFVSSRLPIEMQNQLRIFLDKVNKPLAVRSSSKLEDSLFQPFAGIYSTYMLPLTENKDQMLRLLSKAIKSVYASVFFAASRNYIQTTANLLSEEKMALVIQTLCGTEENGYFFPTMSGLARSVNYYPVGHEQPDDGIVNLAYGLGKLVVEGGRALRFSPRYPRNVMQTMNPKSALNETQNVMYALNLRPEEFKTSIDDGVNIRKFTVAESSGFRNITHVASTWDMDNDILVPGTHLKGRRVITFDNILQNDTIPLAAILADLLEICRNEMRCHVEIEFAVDMDVPAGNDAIFSLLQVRPITDYGENTEFNWDEANIQKALIYSENVLGPGDIEGVTDVVYVRTDIFDSRNTIAYAQELEELNKKMKEEHRTYVLIGPGRWGSSDPWLGIPINWNNISEARVIVECSLENFQVDPSEGTHFFHNLTSLGVGYMNVKPFRSEGVFNETLLNKMDAWYQSDAIRAVRFPRELIINADGRLRKGIIIPAK
ncbi:MAG TPA: PEP/pyruvate-binding domain-containing protein [Bacteroidales bacterium]|mgnify:FL=1|nr:PEP/pyruvate-binding domain-containing protein [Bacteroidales bacterium]HRW95286.1 PEP/pyruvate-binding domain-containing protein [Bacteroidales bacterium]